MRGSDFDVAPGYGAVLGIAFEREFEGDHDVQDLLGSDEELGFVKDGVANVGVEFAPIASGWDFAGDGVAVFDEREFAKVFLFFDDPGGAGWDLAVAQSGLEGIEFAFEVTSLFAQDNEARARDGGHHGGPEENAGAIGIVEKNVEGVVGGEAGAFDADVGGDGFGSAEKRDGLINEMGREIEEDAAAGARYFPPSVGFRSGTEAIVGGFEAKDAAEVARGDGFAEGLKVGVEASVVVDRKHEIFLLGEL